MSQNHYTESLLDCKEFLVTNLESTPTEIHISLQQPRVTHSCPCCGTPTNTIHDYRVQKVKDAPIQGKQTILHVRKRRYRCTECGKRFAENNTFLSRYQRVTGRLRKYIISRFAQCRSAANIAQECHCSTTTALRYFQTVSFPRPQLQSVLAIDEYKGNAGGEKFQCILANPKKKEILDILPSRKSEALFEYFSKFDAGQKNNVKYVVMDMSSLFRSVIRTVFPKAQIVADKFHVCRLITWAMERVRIRVQKSFHKTRRRYFKKSRWILLKKEADLKEEEKEQLTQMLSLSKDLRNAYLLKEKFYGVMDSKNGTEAAKRLGEWNLHAGIMNLEEFNSAVNTLSEWSREIVAAFETGYSNGFVEGMNNRTKVLKRVCYGMRNFNRFRNRILYLERKNQERKNSKKKKQPC